MLLSEILPRTADERPREVAVECGPVTLSYAALADRVARLAAGLAGLGVGRGHRVAILHRNCHRMLEAYLAAARAGAVLVPLNHRLTAKDLAYIVDETESRVLIADDGWAGPAREIRGLARTPCRVVWSATTGGAAPEPGEPEYEALIAASTPASPGEAPGRTDDPAQIYYTSGTTGHHKGVVLTHGNVVSHALATIDELDITARDVWLHAAPMFHLADAWAVWAVTRAGGRHVMCGRFEPAGVLAALRSRRVTLTNLIPTMLGDLVHHAEAASAGFPDLRLIMSGGAPIAPSLVRGILDTFGCEYVQTYGLTETSPYLTFSLLEPHLRRLSPARQLRFRCKTGRAARGVTLRVIDDGGRDVPADGRSVGEIVARGDRVTPGYWKRPDATAEAFRDGWFHTGDLATIDGEGYLDIVDRKKDVIITGGEIVYSTEVEHALHEHPAVLEAAVVGLPHARLGEIVHAEVVARPGAAVTPEDLIAHCRGRVAGYKCPRSVRLAEALPRTGSGKIAKREIRHRRSENGPGAPGD